MVERTSESSLHSRKVIYVTTEDEMNRLIQSYIIDKACVTIGLAFKSKVVNKMDRKKKMTVLQFSTHEVSLVMHVALFGPGWAPKGESALKDVMQEVAIKKVGLNVLQLVGLMKDYDFECKGVYDLIPMAGRVKEAAHFKGYSKYVFPDVNNTQQLNKAIWALADLALNADSSMPEGIESFKTPSWVHSANWNDEMSPEVLDSVSYEAVVAQRVHVFLGDVENDIQDAKGPTALYLTNLPHDVTAEELVAFFGCNSVKQPKIRTAPKNRSTANADIFFNEKEEMEAALAKFDKQIFREREVLMSSAEDELKTVEQQMQQDRAGFQVYISNLPYFTTEDQLRRHFSKLGDQIKEAKFYCHQDLGVGSVYFKTREAADQAEQEYQMSKFLYAVNKVDPVSKQTIVERKFRIIMLDMDFQTVIKRQKRDDRRVGKGEAQYDALDPYYSHQQRPRKHMPDDSETFGPQASALIDEEKPRMRVEGAGDKPKMHVVNAEDAVDRARTEAVKRSIGMTFGKDAANSPPTEPVEFVRTYTTESVAKASPPRDPPTPPSSDPPPAARTSSKDIPVAPAHVQPPPLPQQAQAQAQSSDRDLSQAAAAAVQQQRMAQLLQQHTQQKAMQQNNLQSNMQQQQQQRQQQLQQQLMQQQLYQQQILLHYQRQQQMAQQMQQQQQQKGGKHHRDNHHNKNEKSPASSNLTATAAPFVSQQQQQQPQQGAQAGYYQQLMQSHMMNSGNSSQASLAAGAGFAGAAGAAAAAAGRTTNAVHVIGLPYPCQKNDLCEHFARVGQVVSCQIQQSKGSGGKGNATIAFSNPQVAQAACDKLHGMAFQDHILTVDLYRPRAARMPAKPLTADSFGGPVERVEVEKPVSQKLNIEKPPKKEE
eukprot:TRINITY_DN484_c3_g1_i1.p1 TRINITY_DN484_c3_g1~~TRINITY_DN484_c3_g1_i1.p1  ORF type:complete len:879 (+),score=466.94 TRINITY_DN484_c3_g1_i1:53-2689(+)